VNIASRFITFCIVGGTATFVHYALLVILVTWASVTPVLASSVGFIIAAIVNYWLNYHLTFRSSLDHHVAFLRFCVVASTGLAINALTMHIGVAVLQFHYLLVQIVATGVVLIWNFVLHDRWSFGGQVDRS
jgi:putative flippase GtrA